MKVGDLVVVRSKIGIGEFETFLGICVCVDQFPRSFNRVSTCVRYQFLTVGGIKHVIDSLRKTVNVYEVIS